MTNIDELKYIYLLEESKQFNLGDGPTDIKYPYKFSWESHLYYYNTNYEIQHPRNFLKADDITCLSPAPKWSVDKYPDDLYVANQMYKFQCWFVWNKFLPMFIEKMNKIDGQKIIWLIGGTVAANIHLINTGKDKIPLMTNDVDIITNDSRVKQIIIDIMTSCIGDNNNILCSLNIKINENLKVDWVATGVAYTYQYNDIQYEWGIGDIIHHDDTDIILPYYIQDNKIVSSETRDYINVRTIEYIQESLSTGAGQKYKKFRKILNSNYWNEQMEQNNVHRPTYENIYNNFKLYNNTINWIHLLIKRHVVNYDFGIYDASIILRSIKNNILQKIVDHILESNYKELYYDIINSLYTPDIKLIFRNENDRNNACTELVNILSNILHKQSDGPYFDYVDTGCINYIKYAISLRYPNIINLEFNIYEDTTHQITLYFDRVDNGKTYSKTIIDANVNDDERYYSRYNVKNYVNLITTNIDNQTGKDLLRILLFFNCLNNNYTHQYIIEECDINDLKSMYDTIVSKINIIMDNSNLPFSNLIYLESKGNDDFTIEYNPCLDKWAELLTNYLFKEPLTINNDTITIDSIDLNNYTNELIQIDECDKFIYNYTHQAYKQLNSYMYDMIYDDKEEDPVFETRNKFIFSTALALTKKYDCLFIDPIYLYRGENNINISNFGGWFNMKKGDVIITPTLYSTSLNIGSSFSHKDIILKIKIYNDSVVLYLLNHSSKRNEKEVLIPYGAKLKVIDCEYYSYDGNLKYFIELEYIGLCDIVLRDDHTIKSFTDYYRKEYLKHNPINLRLGELKVYDSAYDSAYDFDYDFLANDYYNDLYIDDSHYKKLKAVDPECPYIDIDPNIELHLSYNPVAPVMEEYKNDIPMFGENGLGPGYKNRGLYGILTYNVNNFVRIYPIVDDDDDMQGLNQLNGRSNIHYVMKRIIKISKNYDINVICLQDVCCPYSDDDNIRNGTLTGLVEEMKKLGFIYYLIGNCNYNPNVETIVGNYHFLANCIFSKIKPINTNIYPLGGNQIALEYDIKINNINITIINTKLGLNYQNANYIPYASICAFYTKMQINKLIEIMNNKKLYILVGDMNSDICKDPFFKLLGERFDCNEDIKITNFHNYTIENSIVVDFILISNDLKHYIEPIHNNSIECYDSTHYPVINIFRVLKDIKTLRRNRIVNYYGRNKNLGIFFGSIKAAKRILPEYNNLFDIYITKTESYVYPFEFKVLDEDHTYLTDEIQHYINNKLKITLYFNEYQFNKIKDILDLPMFNQCSDITYKHHGYNVALKVYEYIPPSTQVGGNKFKKLYYVNKQNYKKLIASKKI
jgi:hypothetical protein